MTELQKLKLKLLEMYQGDIVNAKLAFLFIIEPNSGIGSDFDIDKYKKDKKDGKRTYMD